MITIIRDADGKITELTTEYRHGGENRNDWKDFATVEAVAQEATTFTGKPHVAVDNGTHHYPRFDIAAVPQVGDPVSYAFNGDSYPCGHVAKVSKTLIITTTEGKRFYRRKLTGGWKMEGGTWSLTHGHVYKQNPSF